MGLYCLLGACPVFVADTAGREISSPYIGKPGILHQFSVAYPVSTSVLCNNYFWFRSVPFLSVPGFPASHKNGFVKAGIAEAISNPEKISPVPPTDDVADPFSDLD